MCGYGSVENIVYMYVDSERERKLLFFVRCVSSVFLVTREQQVVERGCHLFLWVDVLESLSCSSSNTRPKLWGVSIELWICSLGCSTGQTSTDFGLGVTMEPELVIHNCSINSIQEIWKRKWPIRILGKHFCWSIFYEIFQSANGVIN